jgi:hypothetical protein
VTTKLRANEKDYRTQINQLQSKVDLQEQKIQRMRIKITEVRKSEEATRNALVK